MVTVEGERRFAAPPERVFALLTDPEVAVSSVPGVRGHTVVDDDRWDAKVKPPLPLAPSVKIHFRVVDRRAPEHASLHANGGGVRVESSFDLAPDTDSGTIMRWRASLELTGVLGALAGPSLEPLARRQADRMLDRVEERL